MTTLEAELTVGSRAPDLSFRTPDGPPLQLSAIWSEKPVALIFLSALDGAFAPECATLWRDAQERMHEAGGQVVAVCAAPSAEAESFRRRWHLPYTLLCEAAEGYAAFGVSGSQPGSFVIDGEGTLTYVHHNRDELDYAPTWDLIEAVGKVTGTAVERPSLTPVGPNAEIAELVEDDEFQMLGGMLQFTCVKCGGNDYEVVDVSSTSGMMSRMVNLQNRRFSAVVCRRCKYTEFYKTESGALRNIFDFLVGT